MIGVSLNGMYIKCCWMQKKNKRIDRYEKGLLEKQCLYIVQIDIASPATLSS